MSRIGSSSGVRVAAQPLSNVYTVLLLIGALTLLLVAVGLGITMDERYGVVFGISDEGKQALRAPDDAAARQASARAELEKVAEALKRFPEGVAAPGAPAAEGGQATPGAPAAPAEQAAPAEPAAPAAAPPAAPAGG